MPLSHHGPPVNSSEYPKYLSSIAGHSISQNIASNSPDSRAGCPWNFKRVYTRVQRKGGQSYHRPPVNSSEFLASYNKESQQT